MGTFSVTPELIKAGLNLIMVLVVLLCSIRGFKRGTKKSIFYMICTIIVIVCSYLFSNKLCDVLMNVDLSALGQSFTINGANYALTTPKAFLTNVINGVVFGGATSTDTATYGLVIALVYMVFRIVFFIITAILAFTLYKFIFDHIWFIFRPRKVKYENGKKKRPKPSNGSRMGGFAIGIAKGLVYCLLIFALWAGISSIVTSYETAIDELNSSNVTVVLKDGTATIVKLADDDTQTGGITDPLGEYRSYLDLIASYKKSAVGQVFGSIKINGDSIDEYVFDKVFSVNGTYATSTDDSGETLSYDIKLRKELQSVAKAISNVPELLSSDLSLNTLLDMDKEKLQGAFDALSELEIVKVVIPVGVEVVFTGNLLDDQLPQEVKDAIANVDVDALKQIDAQADIKNLGTAFVNVLDIVSENFVDDNGNLTLTDSEGKIDYNKLLSMDSETVSKVFDSIGNVTLLKEAAPIAVTYVVNNDDIKNSLNEMGIDITKMDLESIDDWGAEISNIGEIYRAINEANLDLDDLMNLDFTTLDIEFVDNLINSIFTSKLISNAQAVVVDKLNEVITSSLGEYASLVQLPEDDNLKDELVPLLKAVVTLLKTNILTKDSSNMIDLGALENLNSDVMMQLSGYLAESKILVKAINTLVNDYVGSSEGKKIKIPFDLTGFDSETLWTKEEFYAVFNTISIALKSDIVAYLVKEENPVTGVEYTLTDLVDSFKTDGEGHAVLYDIFDSLLSSQFIQQNLGSVVNFALDKVKTSVNFELTNIEDEDWNIDELNAFINVIQIAIDSDLAQTFIDGGTVDLKDVLQKLKSDDDGNSVLKDVIASLAESKFLITNMSAVIDYAAGVVDEKIGLSINNLDDWSKNDLTQLFAFAQVIIDSETADVLVEHYKDENLVNLIIPTLKTRTDHTSVLTDIGGALGDSAFIRNNIKNGVDFALSKVAKDSTINLVNIDWDKEDVVDLFKVVQVLVDSDLTDLITAGGDVNKTQLALDAVKTKGSSAVFTDLIDAIGDCEFVMANLKELMGFALTLVPESTGVTLTNLDTWTKDDLNQLFAFVQVALDSGILDVALDNTVTNKVPAIMDLLKSDGDKAFITDFADKLATSRFIQTNFGAFVDLGLSKLPEGITLTNITWTKDEIVKLFNVAQVAIDTEVADVFFDSEVTNKVQGAIEVLKTNGTTQQLMNLADALGDSAFIVSNMGNLVDFGKSKLPEGLELDNITWTKAEIVNLFNVVQVAVDSGVVDVFFDSTVTNKVQGAVEVLKTNGETQQLMNLANALGDSAFIVSNMGNLVDFGKSKLPEGITLTNITWTKKDIVDLFNVVQVGVDSGVADLVFKKEGTTLAGVLEGLKTTGDDSVVDDLRDSIKGSAFIMTNIDSLVEFGLTKSPIALEKDFDFDTTDVDGLFALVKYAIEKDIVKDLTATENKKSVIEVVKGLSTTDVEELGTVLAQNRIVTKNLNSLVQTYVEPKLKENAEDENVLDYTTTWTASELTALLKAAHYVLNTTLLDTSDGKTIMDNVKALDDTTIDTLADLLTKSNFVTTNLTPLFRFAEKKFLSSLVSTELDLTGVTWNATEVAGLLKSVRDLMSTGVVGGDDPMAAINDMDNNTLKTLSKDLASTKTLKNNLVPIINTLIEGFSLGIDPVEDFEFSSNFYTSRGEVYDLFKALQEIVAAMDDPDGLMSILNANEATLNTIFRSEFVTKLLVSYVKANAKSGESLEIIADGVSEVDEADWCDSFANVQYTVANNNYVFDSAKTVEVYVDGVYVETVTASTIPTNTYENVNEISFKVRTNGEVHNLFTSVSVIMSKSSATTLDADTVVANVMKLSDAEIDTVLTSTILSVVLTSQIEALGEGADAQLVVKPITDINATLKGLLTSLRTLFGETFDINSISLDVDTILGKSKADLATIINSSTIVKDTFAKTLEGIIFGSSMEDIIALPDYGAASTDDAKYEVRINSINADMLNLIYALKDLDSKGIAYDAITYEGLKTNIATSADAVTISDYICQSDILSSSLTKMLKSFLSGAVDDTTSVNAVLDTLSIADYKNTTSKVGELALVLNALSIIDSMTGSITLEGDAMKNNLKALNASKVLSVLLPGYIEDALDAVADWKRTNATLSQAEWYYEIDVLFDLLSQDTDNISIGNAATTTLLKTIAQSRLLDIDKKLPTLINDCLEESFTDKTFVTTHATVAADYSTVSGTYTTTLSGTSFVYNVSYTNAAYTTYVSAWEDEIDNLMTAINYLNTIDLDPTRFVDYTSVPGDDKYQGVVNAGEVGRFFDLALNAKLLASNVAEMSTYEIGTYASYEAAYKANVKEMLDNPTL